MDLEAIQGYASDSLGNPAAPEVGRSFFAAIRYRVAGPLSSTYRVRFETTYCRMDTPPLAFGLGAPGEYTVVWGPIPVLMDRPVEVTAILDFERRLRESDRTDNKLSFTVVPRSPAAPIDQYDPEPFDAELGLTIAWRRGPLPTRLVVWTPDPPESRNQAVNTVALDGATRDLAAPFGEGIQVLDLAYPGAGPHEFRLAFSGVASSVRVALGELTQSRFDDYQGVPDAAFWLAPETYVESSHPEFARAVNQLLPTGFRTSLSPVEAAERLYVGLLARCSYRLQFGAKPNAFATWRSRKGDCGGLSAAFVALCRAAGIPARAVTGFLGGANRWHVWAEFLDPRFGWVPVDPAFAEGRQPQASVPIYFGVIPELNKRVATGLGFDREAMGLRAPILQSPAAFWFGARTNPSILRPFSSLSPASLP